MLTPTFAVPLGVDSRHRLQICTHARQLCCPVALLLWAHGGFFPAHYALLFTSCKKHAFEILSGAQLLAAGADPTLKISPHMGPLGTVAIGPRTKASPALGPPLVRALVAAGADVNGVRAIGLAPLHIACSMGACAEVIQALLDAGADACMPCAGRHFKTPLQLAVDSGNVGAVTVLVGHPAHGGLNRLGASPSRLVCIGGSSAQMVPLFVSRSTQQCLISCRIFVRCVQDCLRKDKFLFKMMFELSWRSFVAILLFKIQDHRPRLCRSPR